MVISVTTTMTTMTTVAAATTTVKWKVEGKCGVCVTENPVGVGHFAITRFQSHCTCHPRLVIVLLELKSSKDPHS